jgi:hypothetical protein
LTGGGGFFAGLATADELASRHSKPRSNRLQIVLVSRDT